MSNEFKGAGKVFPYYVRRAIENYEADREAWKQHEDMLKERFISSFKNGVWKTQRENAQRYLSNTPYDSECWDSNVKVMANKVGVDIVNYHPFLDRQGYVRWEDEYNTLSNLAGKHVTEIFLTPSQTKFVELWQMRYIEDLGVREVYSESLYSQCIHRELEEQRYYSMPRWRDILLKDSDIPIAGWFSGFGGLLLVFDDDQLSPIQKWRVKRRIKKFLKKENK